MGTSCAARTPRPSKDAASTHNRKRIARRPEKRGPRRGRSECVCRKAPPTITLELHLWRLIRTFVCCEVRFGLESKEACNQVGRKPCYPRVEGLRSLNESTALNPDAVLGLFQFQLQISEILGRLEFRIRFRHGHQSRQRGGQSRLSLLKALECGRIVCDVLQPFRGNLADTRSRLGN